MPKGDITSDQAHIVHVELARMYPDAHQSPKWTKCNSCRDRLRKLNITIEGRDVTKWPRR